jgi:hypothetical protein
MVTIASAAIARMPENVASEARSAASLAFRSVMSRPS